MYVGDEGGVSTRDERRIKDWLAVWMTCLMLLRKLTVGWSRITRPSFSEDGRLKNMKNRINDKEET